MKEGTQHLTLSGTSTIFSIFGFGSICDIGTTHMFLFTGIFNCTGSSASGFSTITGAFTTSFSCTPVFSEIQESYLLKTYSSTVYLIVYSIIDGAARESLLFVGISIRTDSSKSISFVSLSRRSTTWFIFGPLITVTLSFLPTIFIRAKIEIEI